MNDLLSDVRYGFRGLVGRPGLTVSVVLVLGLGIGANTTIFSLVNALLLEPLPGVAEPATLVSVGRTADGEGFGTLALPDFRDYHDRAVTLSPSGDQGGETLSPKTLSGLAAIQYRGFTFGSDGHFERLMGTLVSGEYFELLGTRAALGRTLTPSDGEAAAPVAVLSHRLWQQRFAGRDDVLGQTVTLDGQPLSVVGVAAKGFRGTKVLWRADVWIPLELHPRLMPGFAETAARRDAVWLEAFGRLRPGASIAGAQAELDGIAASLAKTYPESNQGRGVAIAALGLRPGTREDILNMSTVLMLIAAAVLLVACANVANLLLARASGAARWASGERWGRAGDGCSGCWPTRLCCFRCWAEHWAYC